MASSVNADSANVAALANNVKPNVGAPSPMQLYVALAKDSTNAAYATRAGSATDSTKLPLAGGTLRGLLYANRGISASATGSSMWNGWNQVYRVSTGSHGAFHNPSGGAFVGLHNNSTIYFGRSSSYWSGQYYGYINSGGFYDAGWNRLATESYVNSKVSSGGSISYISGWKTSSAPVRLPGSSSYKYVWWGFEIGRDRDILRSGQGTSYGGNVVWGGFESYGHQFVGYYIRIN